MKARQFLLRRKVPWHLHLVGSAPTNRSIEEKLVYMTCRTLPASVPPHKIHGADDSHGALAVSLPSDPELARLIDAWPTLPEALKAGIMAMIDSARKS
jgi:hypothetical protein